MALAVSSAPQNSTGCIAPPPVIDPNPIVFEKLEMTDKQKELWEATMTLMVWTCPGFLHLFFSLLSDKSGKAAPVLTTAVPVAATDARHIMLNPEPYFAYPLKQRVFILGHEIVHNVYNDIEYLSRCATSGVVPMDDGTTLPFRNETLQKAFDYRINPLLRDSKIGEPPEDCCMDDTIGKAHDSIGDVYRRVYEDEESGGKKTGKRRYFDIVMPPGASNNTPNQGRDQQQWQVAIAAAQTIEQNRNQGTMSGALQRMFEEILNPVVPWTDHIRGIFNRKVGSGTYNWRRPDRRFIARDLYMPSRSGNGAGWIVVWGDSSGSTTCSPDDICRYFAEFGSIIEDCKPQRLTVVWCDSDIQRIDEIEDAHDLQECRFKGVPGGGGTDCQPVFDWIAEHTEKPEVFIGFTDGYVGFPPMEPDYLCIWASTTSRDYPWGDVVRINPDK